MVCLASLLWSFWADCLATVHVACFCGLSGETFTGVSGERVLVLERLGEDGEGDGDEEDEGDEEGDGNGDAIRAISLSRDGDGALERLGEDEGDDEGDGDV